MIKARPRLGHRIGLAAVTAAVCVAGIITAPSAAYADPSTDPFYKPPTKLPAGAPGDIIKMDSFNPQALPGWNLLDANAWRVMYRSTSATGKPIAVTGGVLVPKAPYKGPGKRPLVGLGPGTKGLADHCAPTYGLSIGLDYEGLAVMSYLSRGWAVAITDYEGLGTPGDATYMVGRSQGQSVLDVMRAATRVTGSGLPKNTPMGVAGYSQGGSTAGWAAELASRYAPELDIKGVAAGGTPADLTRVAEHLDGDLFFGFMGQAAIGYDAAYDDLELDPYMTKVGRTLREEARNSCVGPSIPSGAFKKMSDLVTEDLFSTPQWQARLAQNKLGRTAPDMPVLLYHSVIDQIIPFDQAKKLRGQWCSAGTKVDWREYYLGEHALVIATGIGEVQNWLADRFAGKPVKGNCSA